MILRLVKSKVGHEWWYHDKMDHGNRWPYRGCGYVRALYTNCSMLKRTTIEGVFFSSSSQIKVVFHQNFIRNNWKLQFYSLFCWRLWNLFWFFIMQIQYHAYFRKQCNPFPVPPFSITNYRYKFEKSGCLVSWKMYRFASSVHHWTQN